MAEVRMQAAGLLFDMDGVLISSIGSVTRCWRRWAAEYGVVDADKVEIAHGSRAVDIMQKLVPDVDTAAGLRLIEDMEIEDVSDLQVLPGARVLLQSLPAELWAIVTSATFRLVIARLQAAGLPHPERLVAGDHVVHGKPHPEPYRRGAAMIGAASADCIVVEDAPTGVRSGRAAGSRVLAVLGTHSARELREAGAEWVVQSLEGVTASAVDGGLELRFEDVAP